MSRKIILNWGVMMSASSMGTSGGENRIVAAWAMAIRIEKLLTLLTWQVA